uniref:Uncharacterized protein n=1 Tax=Rhizophora mucronata TaxID=61149 RepID=A0A2P2NG85_RHIMU
MPRYTQVLETLITIHNLQKICKDILRTRCIYPFIFTIIKTLQLSTTDPFKVTALV